MIKKLFNLSIGLMLLAGFIKAIHNNNNNNNSFIEQYLSLVGGVMWLINAKKDK